MRTLTQDKRVWLAGGALVAVLIVVVGWFFVVSPELSAASSTRAQAESATAQNVVSQAKNTKLKEANDNASALRAGLATALTELPSDGGLPAFTRQLSAQATANAIELTSVVVGNSAPVDAKPAVTGTTSADAGATSAAAASATSSTGLVAIPITVVATGSCSGDLAFLQAIQVTGPRRALVSNVQLAPATGEAPCTLTLQLTIFSAPLTPEAQTALEKLLSGG